MNIFSNEKLIRRNGKLGNYLSLGAFGLMLVGMYFSFQLTDPKVAQANENYTWWMAGSLFVGFILFQIGTYFMNRFGRRPRPDEALEASLKGLTKDYTLYEYLTPVSHLLVGPAGVWIIETFYQRGNITYQGDRWHQRGGGLMLQYMKIFGQEGLGRPDLEIKADLENINKLIKEKLGDVVIPVNVAMVFLDDRAVVNADGSPYPMLRPKELKEFLRKYAKANPFSAAQAKQVTEFLPEESIP